MRGHLLSVVVLFVASGSACVLGTKGLGQETSGAAASGAGAGTTTSLSGGGGAQPTSTTTSLSGGGGVEGGSGGSGGAGGSTAGGGSGGSPPLPVCDDGRVEPPEQCEDDNSVSGDGCDAQCRLEASCGNSTVEPGEACDAPIDCTDCEPAAASVCVGAPVLPMGTFSGDTTGSTLTTFGNVADDFAATDCIDAASAAPIRLYRHDVGSYPEGVALLVRPGGFPFDDSVVWSYLGCGAAPIACDDDNESTWLYASGSLMFTRLLPAHSVAFVAVKDFDANAAGAFTGYSKRFRYGTWFSRGLGGVALDSGWYGPAGGRISASASSGTAVDTSATTPEFYLAGLTTLEVVFEQTLNAVSGATADVEASFDGGAWQATSFAAVTGYDADANVLETATVAVPTGALHAKVRFRLRDGTGYSGSSWLLDGVLVGPP